MEFFFEVVLQFVGEIVVQAVFEVIAEIGFHSLADTFRRPKNPALSTIGFALWGLAAGAISVWIFPTSHIHNPLFRKLNLIVTPAAVGFLMTLIGKIRVNKGQDRMRIDRFGYAFVFAFAMALIRFIWAA
jgi:multisubunit Na+/H+ antiporter MnhG subunit